MVNLFLWHFISGEEWTEIRSSTGSDVTVLWHGTENVATVFWHTTGSADTALWVETGSDITWGDATKIWHWLLSVTISSSSRSITAASSFDVVRCRSIACDFNRCSCVVARYSFDDVRCLISRNAMPCRQTSSALSVDSKSESRKTFLILRISFSIRTIIINFFF